MDGAVLGVGERRVSTGEERADRCRRVRQNLSIPDFEVSLSGKVSQ